ncbi:MAG TPA: hypothetical protein VFW07_27790 [Parafilimonas sp.]|nr:hypothetical protein [Parafilimonas sp.]
MKKTIFLLLLSFIALGTHAQVNNSKWKTTLQLDQPVDVVFNFSTDTLDVTEAADNSSLETMKYTLKDTVLTIQKLYGQSECDPATIGSYTCTINGDEMHLKIISDDCDDRGNVIADIKLNRTE